MRHWSREVIERFLMHKSVVLAAAVLFAAAFFAAVFVNSTGDISVSGHKISWSIPRSQHLLCSQRKKELSLSAILMR